MTQTSAFVVGLTGGMGSGKSHVMALLAQRGYPVYDADRAARTLMDSSEPLREGIRNVFGPEVFLPEGHLNRAALGQRVFADARQLQKLNALVHPAVAHDFAEWKAEQDARKDRPLLLFKEAAILFEAGTDAGCQATVTVYAPQRLRVQRVMQRDGLAEADVLQRMARQWPDARKRFLATWVLYNDGVHELVPQLQTLLEQLLAQARVLTRGA